MADNTGEQPQTDVLLADDDIASDNDSALGESTTSSTASLASSILDYRKENGRTYHAYKEGSYHFPNDERENERLDLQHHIFYLTLEGKLGLSPPCQTGSKVERVLDVGTGTGIWAIDYGDEYPDTEVVGIDLSATQPSLSVPSNVFFQVDDLEDTWTYSKPFDFIHSRMMNSSVSNWPEYIKKCYENLKPGGYLELQDFTLPLSDDGTLKPENALQRSMDLLGEAAAKFNHAFVDLNALKGMLVDAGFEGVVEVRYKWPSNTWPREKRHKVLGLWNHQNMIQGMSGFLMAALTRALGWSKEEVDVLDVQTRLDLSNKTIHAYWPIYVVYGKKPEAAATTG